MRRSLATAATFALITPLLALPASSRAVDHPGSMHFALRMEGPAASCASHCRLIVAAQGSITADTPRDFQNFVKGRKLKGALVVLESEGGSVHGAIALGREIRALGFDTTVGAVNDLPAAASGLQRARISPRADCESMCAFVLLAGIHRTVPPQARVMVHEIWLGDRRDDPTAATYSAEDLALVQRDIGRLARYTADMGASIEVLDLALRIPPWEPMHTMTTAEMIRTRMATANSAAPVAASVPVTADVAVSKIVPDERPAKLLQTTNGVQAAQISERHWSLVDRQGTATLARSQPLTFEGNEIGNFDLMLSCGTSGSYDVGYLEHRHRNGDQRLPPSLQQISVAIGNTAATLKVVSSQHRGAPDELVTFATGTLPASLVDSFAAAGDRSLMVQTNSPSLTTDIRVGNTGVQENLPQLAAQCPKNSSEHADLSLDKIEGGAAAK